MLTAIIPTMATKGPSKRLMDSELKIKQENELCCKCDEKISIGYRSKKKGLQVMMMQEGEEYMNEEPAMKVQGSNQVAEQKKKISSKWSKFYTLKLFVHIPFNSKKLGGSLLPSWLYQCFNLTSAFRKTSALPG